MLLKHVDIWRAIDLLAERNGLSPSGLALKAGLSSTSFNPSKRHAGGRKRWPSTESVALVLQATGISLNDFVNLVSSGGGGTGTGLPMIGLKAALRPSAFGEDGKPSGRGWEDVRFPALTDPHAFMIEISGKGLEPVYREGDRIVVSPAERPRRGDRVAVRTEKGEVTIGELGRESTQKIELLPFNSGTAAAEISPHDVEWMYRIVWASQ